MLKNQHLINISLFYNSRKNPGSFFISVRKIRKGKQYRRFIPVFHAVFIAVSLFSPGPYNRLFTLPFNV
jgi:hypothetical protein